MTSDHTANGRIQDHPILGKTEERACVTIYLDGAPVEAREGDTIASALWAAGVRTFRYSPKRHEARGLFCAIGYCSDCMMTVDGVPNTRTCITPVKDGMRIEVQDGNGDWSRVIDGDA